MLRQKTKLIDTLTSDELDNLFSGNVVGIFTGLVQDSDPWYSYAYAMCSEWYLQRSGNKPIAPMWAMMINQSRDWATIIPTMLRAKYLTNWAKIWEALNAEYTPLDSVSGSKTYTDTHTYDLSEERNSEVNDNGTTSTTGSSTDGTTTSDSNKYYGFNSSTAANKDSSSGSVQRSVQDNDSGETHRTTIGDEGKTKTGTETIVHTENMYYRDKSGAELTAAEVEFRVLNNFTEIFLSSIDKFLVLAVYLDPISETLLGGTNIVANGITPDDITLNEIYLAGATVTYDSDGIHLSGDQIVTYEQNGTVKTATQPTNMVIPITNGSNVSMAANTSNSSVLISAKDSETPSDVTLNKVYLDGVTVTYGSDGIHLSGNQVVTYTYNGKANIATQPTQMIIPIISGDNVTIAANSSKDAVVISSTGGGSTTTTGVSVTDVSIAQIYPTTRDVLVTYDSTDGMRLQGTTLLAYTDSSGNTATHEIHPTNMHIPLQAGSGITLAPNATTDATALVISATGVGATVYELSSLTTAAMPAWTGDITAFAGWIIKYNDYYYTPAGFEVDTEIRARYISIVNSTSGTFYTLDLAYNKTDYSAMGVTTGGTAEEPVKTYSDYISLLFADGTTTDVYYDGANIQYWYEIAGEYGQDGGQILLEGHMYGNAYYCYSDDSTVRWYIYTTSLYNTPVYGSDTVVNKGDYFAKAVK